MKSFLGKINFLWKFILDFVQIVKPMQDMIKKDAVYSWDKRENFSFTRIKQDITYVPTLYNPKFKKDFLLYTFASDKSFTAVLTHKDKMNDECPISFMSASMQGLEINYPAFDKQAYVVYKAVKHFRPYSLKNHCIVFVPHPAVRTLCVQQELGERCVNWMTGLQEYDLEIKPINTIKGHGMCRLAAKVVHGPESEEELADWE